MSIFGIGGTKNGDANDYVNGGKLSVSVHSFYGTLAQLNELISRETDECAQEVKDGGVLRSKTASRSACSDAIHQYYAPALQRLQSESYTQESQVIDEFLSGNNTLYIVAGVGVALILLVLFL